MDNIKNCPKCNTENPVVANFCRHCRYDFPDATKNGQSLKPIIKYIKVKELNYLIGSKVNIEWEVDNYTKIELQGEDVSVFKNVEILVEKASSLLFSVYNDYDQISEYINVVPLPNLSIRKYTASKFKIKRGEAITLSWDIDNAVESYIEYTGYKIAVHSSDKLTIYPAIDTIFALTAFSADRSVFVQKELEIQVFNEVIIKSFNSDKISIVETESIQLYWEVHNADKIYLLPSNVDVSSMSSYKVAPSRTTTYYLRAENELYSQQMAVTINVTVLPKFDTKVIPIITTDNLHFSMDKYPLIRESNTIEDIELLEISKNRVMLRISSLFNIAMNDILKIINRNSSR